MRLNSIAPVAGSRPPRKRVARGSSSGTGKTGGRGHKGQKSRTGGSVARGFEGGQMPLQRRLPKVGFASRQARYGDQVRLCDLARIEDPVIDRAALHRARLVSASVRQVKVILKGTIERAITLRGVAATRGARAAIEAAGGKVED